jgi:hypothetical protein
MRSEHDAVDGGNVGEHLVLQPELAKERIREKLPASVG